jgi:uncharacterized membrane protein
MVVVAALAMKDGVSVHELFAVDPARRVSAWRALALSITTVAVGYYVVSSTTIGPSRSNEMLQLLQRWLKLSGWLFMVGGSLIAIRVISVLVGWLQQ